MIGIIESLNRGNAGGVIRADDGLRVTFELSGVLAYDIISLAVGRRVRFEMASRNAYDAVNVSVESADRMPHVADKGTEGLRYMGFQHSGSLRAYRFERNSSPIGCGTFIVTTDLELFTRHRVPLQDGPALCLRVIMTLLAEGLPEKPETQLLLTEQDLVDHAAVEISSIAARRRPRRGPFHNAQRFATGFSLPLTGSAGQ